MMGMVPDRNCWCNPNLKTNGKKQDRNRTSQRLKRHLNDLLSFQSFLLAGICEYNLNQLAQQHRSDGPSEQNYDVTPCHFAENHFIPKIHTTTSVQLTPTKIGSNA